MGSTFFDANLYPQGSMGGVPEPLRPKPGQLSLSQQRVYEVCICLLLNVWWDLSLRRALQSLISVHLYLGLCSASLAKPV